MSWHCGCLVGEAVSQDYFTLRPCLGQALAPARYAERGPLDPKWVSTRGNPAFLGQVGTWPGFTVWRCGQEAVGAKAPL